MKKITNIFAMLMLTVVMAACGSVSVSTTATPSGTGTAVTSETGTTGHSVSTGNVDELIAMVNGFVSSGEITGQAENGLLAKLETIKQKVLNGQMDPAANEMGAFVNQVQAQTGKKISDAAATALIAKAQEIASALMAGVPVTGGQETLVPATSQPTEPATGNASKPIPMGNPLEHQMQWDAIALQVAQSVGISTFDYELYQLPANTTWDDTLAYYKTQAAMSGWGDAPGQMDEMAGGHYAAWSMTGADGTTNYFIVAQVDQLDGPYTLNIFGNK